MYFWSWFLPVTALLSQLFFQVLFYWNKGRTFNRLKIQPGMPDKALQRREMAESLVSLVIFTLCGLGMDHLIRIGVIRFLPEQKIPFPGFGVLMVAAMFLIHDAWFYWTHRLLHTRLGYRLIHRHHHHYHNPTPFTTFAFHPVEAVIQIGIVPLLAGLLPVTPDWLIGFSVFLLFMSVYGHSGFELRAEKKGIWKVFNTSIHHNLHHQYAGRNFTIYLNLWDRLMGTNYEGNDQVTARFVQRAHGQAIPDEADA
jgi:sterol desaturase/sphingolipid hydroxylase (fatty acid hydroxylase superfamily)